MSTVRKLRHGLLSDSSALLVGSSLTIALIRFGSNLALAQFLAPQVFGVVAITSLIIAALQMVSDAGIYPSLIRAKDDLEAAEIDRYWSLAVVRGLLLWVVLLPGGWLAAELYDEPLLALVLPAAGATFIIEGARNLCPLIALKNRRVGPSLKVELTTRITAAATSVLLASLWPSVWAMVIGIVAGSLVGSLLGHGMKGALKHRFSLTAEFVRDHWQFSRWIQLSSTISFFAQNTDKILLPLLFSLKTLGIYNIGAMLNQIPFEMTQRWSRMVLLPGIRALVDFPGGAAEIVRVRVSMMTVVGTCAIMIAIIAPVFFTALYPAAFEGAGRICQLLAPGLLFVSTETAMKQNFVARGVAVHEASSVTIRLLMFLALVSVVQDRFGIEGYIACYLSAQLTSLAYVYFVAWRAGYAAPKVELPTFLLLAVLLGSVVATGPLKSPIDGLPFLAIVGLSGVAIMLAILRIRGLPSPRLSRAGASVASDPGLPR